MEGLIGKRPFDTKTTYQEYMDTPPTKTEEPEAEESTKETVEESTEINDSQESTEEPTAA